MMGQVNFDEKDAIISKLRTFFKKREEVIFAYIYGSFIEGLAFRDIDVAVYVKEQAVPKDQAIDYSLKISAQGEMETRVNRLDSRAINYAPVGLKYYATKGILFFSKDEELRCDFLENTWKFYFDLLPKRKRILLDLVTP